MFIDAHATLFMSRKVPTLCEDKCFCIKLLPLVPKVTLFVGLVKIKEGVNFLYIDNCSNIPSFSHHVNPGLSINHSIELRIQTQPSFLSSLLHPLQEKLCSLLKSLLIISYWDDSTFFGFLPNQKNWKEEIFSPPRFEPRTSCAESWCDDH